MHIDVHQHLWPGGLIDELRRRSQPPRLEGWTLRTAAEPPFEVCPADHDARQRAALAAHDGLGLIVLGLSSPLGIEGLPPEQAMPLLGAYHDGIRELGAPYACWAAPCLTEIDPQSLSDQLDQGCVGLQLPATALIDEAGYRRCAPLLDEITRRDLPLFIHPGPAPGPGTGAPEWWAAVVSYVHQLHAAWFAFRAFGRPAFPRLRVCFAALAGLAPLHGERMAARSGRAGPVLGAVDPDLFVETSSYGNRAADAVVRVLGADLLVFGSDRPYAQPHGDLGLGPAFDRALRITNPARLVGAAAETVRPLASRKE
jgi:hypothetical protein